MEELKSHPEFKHPLVRRYSAIALIVGILYETPDKAFSVKELWDLLEARFGNRLPAASPDSLYFLLWRYKNSGYIRRVGRGKYQSGEKPWAV